MMIGITILVVVIVLALIVAALAVRVVQQYERGVVFRLGRVQGNTRGPGLTLITPVIDRLRKVNLQITTMGVPGQDCITRDNVSVRVDAVVYFRVVDPVKALVNVRDYLFAVSQVAQTTLRAVIGRADLDELLSNRDKLNAELTAIIDTPTEGPWGVKVERVEVKDVSLPEGMKRSMSRQAEAERERRARVIAADGEYQASQKLAQAAAAMSGDPAALQLRLLQTVVEVAAEKNSTLVMPFPVELLRFLDHATPNDRSGTVHFAPAVEPGTDVEPTAETAPAVEPSAPAAQATEPAESAVPAVEPDALTTIPAVEPPPPAPPMPADTVASEVPARALEPASGMSGATETSDAPLQPAETEAMPARSESDGPVSPAAAVNGQAATNA
jgi:regulator of protease activity HflC (stomatin/prohibitin superfamily)